MSRSLLVHRHQTLAHHAKLPGLGELKALAGEVKGINAKTAIIVPAILGSMPFFWFCVVLACVSLPAIVVGLEAGLQASHVSANWGLASFFPMWLTQASVVAAIAWIAQTFIQLVALPVLQVSSNSTQGQLEGHVEVILDQLNVETPGGVAEIMGRLDRLEAALRVDSKADPLSGGST